MILVDTCVLLDVVQDDPHWADWSLMGVKLGQTTVLAVLGDCPTAAG